LYSNNVELPTPVTEQHLLTVSWQPPLSFCPLSESLTFVMTAVDLALEQIWTLKTAYLRVLMQMNFFKLGITFKATLVYSVKIQ
jgi:hypothetical protein